MIDKDKMFSLFEQPEGKKDGKELVTFSNSLLEEPFTKIGMFTKLIINHNVFHQKLEKFLKAEKPDYDVQEARRASEFTVFNRAWHYISKIDLEDRNHLEAIMGQDPKKRDGNVLRKRGYRGKEAYKKAGSPNRKQG